MFSHSENEPNQCAGTSAAPSLLAAEGPSPFLPDFILSRTRLVERLLRILLKAQERKRKLA